MDHLHISAPDQGAVTPAENTTRQIPALIPDENSASGFRVEYAEAIITPELEKQLEACAVPAEKVDYSNGLKSLSGMRRLSPEMSDFIYDASEEMDRLTERCDALVKALEELRQRCEGEICDGDLLDRVDAALAAAKVSQ